MFLKQMILKRIKSLTVENILTASKEYGFSINEQEASEMIKFLQSNKIDPFKASHRANMLRELAIITNPETAKKANTLFVTMIRSYGVAHLFEND